MKHLKLFESFTIDDIIKCIDDGKNIEADIIEGFPNKPNSPIIPLSIDNDGLVDVDIDNNKYTVKLNNIKKIVNENLEYMGKSLKDIFPNQIELYTTYGTNIHKLSDVTNENSIIRATYYVDTPSEKNGDVLADGDPDFVGFDIHVINKSNDIKLNVDMTHGDHMIYEFTIESPNKVNVNLYGGVGSKLDSDTHFGLSDKSLSDMIKVFSSFNDKFKLSAKDFTFMDKYPDTYKVEESAKITPLGHGESLLVVNNTEKRENKFIKNILRYLQTRGINYKLVSNIENAKKIDSKKIVGVILTDSEHKINDHDTSLSKFVLDNYKCPIIGIGFGYQVMCKDMGVDIKSNKKLTIEHKILTDIKNSRLFKGIDMKVTKFSFEFYDYPLSCPSGYEVIAKVDNIIVGISNENTNRYGILFHPEDTEKTHDVLDNFIGLCHIGQEEQEKLLQGKFEGIIKFKHFQYISI